MEEQCSVCAGTAQDGVVTCSKCADWYHLRCANEDESVLGKVWRCKRCSSQQAPEESLEPPSNPRPDTPSTYRREAPWVEFPNRPSSHSSGQDDTAMRQISQEFRNVRAHVTQNGDRANASDLQRLEEKMDAMARKMEAAARREAQATWNNPPPCSTTYPTHYDAGFGELSRSQLSARQAVTGRLPTFSGNPEEWPMFLASFNETTRMCGFSDGENVLRLQQALQGRALKAVQCRLRHAGNLEEVMQTLRAMFGRPEIIVESLLEQIRRTAQPKTDKLETLVDFGLVVEEICATVRTSGVENRFDGPLLQELVERLPGTVKLLWGLHVLNLPSLSLEEFGKWMTNVKNASLLVSRPTASSRAHTEERKQQVRVNVHTESPAQQSSEKPPCACERAGCPSTLECESFWRMNPYHRWTHVKASGICQSCLKLHANACRVIRPCGINGCRGKHHRALHSEWTSSAQRTKENLPVPQMSHQADGGSLLKYIPVTLYGRGKSVSVYALLDDGSKVTLIDQQLVKELGLTGTPKPLCLKWTGGQERMESDSIKLDIEISGANNKTKHRIPSVRSVRTLDLGPQSLDMERLAAQYPHLAKAPVSSYKAVTPRILIGSPSAFLMRPLYAMEGASDEPIAMETRLGWVVSGSYSTRGAGSHLNVNHVGLCDCNGLEERIEAALKDSFAPESPNYSNSRLLSREEARATSLLHSLTRMIDDRFETGLLWRYDDIKFPNNRSMALRRMDCLERRMEREPLLRERINQILADHLEKGYIRKLTDGEKATKHSRTWYLPIFPVINSNKPGKVRLVWDAAASLNGTSLNSMLLTGPDLLTSLPSVLQKFREFRIAMAADITEMYHQVKIRVEDQDSQRFLWKWKASQSNPEEYVMTRMTFGATCSPSAAQFVKNRNADRFADCFPRAVECIKSEHYVDDMLTSVEYTAEATQLALDVTHIHSQGGFKLHNWASNAAEVLRVVGGSEHQMKDMNLDATLRPQKVLGMWWNTQCDTFQFKVPGNDRDILQGKTPPSKRQVLSILMSIYDPLGLIAGFLFFLKVLLQDIWRAGVGWDEAIPEELRQKWAQWVACLPHLETIVIPRCYRKALKIEACTVQLHVFVDAGKDGFAAVAYFRFEANGKREVSLIGGRTRVTPLKYVSVPRLELQAAVLGVRLAKAIVETHKIPVNRRVFWTDSKDVICWLNSDHRRYSTYVAHRVGEILTESDTREWQWVSTKFNVADECTKWSKLDHHLTSSRWFTGPVFLAQPEDQWKLELCDPMTTEEEIRHTVAMHQVVEPLIEFDRFSRWRRLHRSVALVWRFIRNTRTPEVHRQRGHLTHKEMQLAERTILVEGQKQAFPEEYRTLLEARAEKGKQNVNKKSPLYRRSPYMDEHGILRVQGRIDACRYVSEETKRPIILARGEHLTELIVDQYHRRYRHGNHQTVINEVRQKFDIPSLRSICHRVRQRCMFCKVRSALPEAPMMGNLPEARLSPYSRPFSFVGVDYFGPLTVVNGRKVEKRWGVLFTCLTVRAIHIEIAHSLTTSSCIMALRNFMARRGVPIEIISDRGTNFIGASRELKEALSQVNTNELIDELYLPDTTWHFNPPAAPHFGGAWERLVQSVKRTLRTIQFTRNPSDSVLLNWLMEVEHIVNCRPLTHVPVDNEEDEPLTPNHFLLGSSSGAKPLTTYDDSSATLKNSWKTSQLYADEFWRKWIKTYLPTLTKRTKWFEPVRPLAEGDVVLVVDENLPRGCWPKGRVVLTEKSRHGEVRKVHVRLASGKTIERPAVKIARLDIGPT